jgi:hypothetical protein
MKSRSDGCIVYTCDMAAHRLDDVQHRMRCRSRRGRQEYTSRQAQDVKAFPGAAWNRATDGPMLRPGDQTRCARRCCHHGMAVLPHRTVSTSLRSSGAHAGDSIENNIVRNARELLVVVKNSDNSWDSLLGTKTLIRSAAVNPKVAWEANWTARVSHPALQIQPTASPECPAFTSCHSCWPSIPFAMPPMRAAVLQIVGPPIRKTRRRRTTETP